MIRRAAAAALALTCAAACAGGGNSGGKDGASSWAPDLSKISLSGSKGTEATLLSGLKRGPYEPSSLAVGEDKDIARHRADGLGYVRSAPLEQYLNDLRRRIVAASGETHVPGRVMILANPSFAAYSTPDGNVFVSIGWLQNLKSEDEVAAILAHESSHVLLKHHSSDVVGTVEKKSLALYEIAVETKAQMSSSKTVSKSDQRTLTNAQLVTDTTDKLVLPAWTRGQEREADLLGIDLLVESNRSAPAMISMLEKLQAWEKANKESEEAFWERMKQVSQRDAGEALRQSYQHLVDAISINHPKTEVRIDESAEYLERHYGDRDLRAPKSGPWNAITARPDVAEVMRNYGRAFSARKQLVAGDARQAYATATSAASGVTATDAYPNWVVAESAAALGRRQDALEALQRAIRSPEPVPVVYEGVILATEQAGQVTTALGWAERASKTFGGAPQWTPHRIRLLRKLGRVSEAGTLTLDCAVNSPEWKRACQEANQTPAGRAAPR
ncbi:MAG TPA: M48 family metalloprotease [Candidatus Methylomirabilis sp.]|nr:M48 family metalloprotease [Candidatus Methylomirabilis sp.]